LGGLINLGGEIGFGVIVKPEHSTIHDSNPFLKSA
jgi:hypothetical protein